MDKEKIKEEVLLKCPAKNCDRDVVERIVDFTIYKTAKAILEDVLEAVDHEDLITLVKKLKKQFGVK